MIEPLFYLSLIIWLKLLVEATSQRGSRCTVMQSSPPSFATSHSQSFFSEKPINTAVKPAVHQTSSDNQTSRQMLESDFQWRKGYWTYSMKRFDSLPIMKKLKLRKTRFLYTLPCRCSGWFLELSNVNPSTDCLLAICIWHQDTNAHELWVWKTLESINM